VSVRVGHHMLAAGTNITGTPAGVTVYNPGLVPVPTPDALLSYGVRE
jgi:hypothetical protein